MSETSYKSIQTRLVELRIRPGPGPIDGLNGRKTKAAVRAFQSGEGDLTVDGKVGPKTHVALHKGLSPKRIAVFCDGTWNSPYSVKTTHVHQLFEATQETEGQTKKYFMGLVLAAN
ncbi:MAG: peptidoglycan-binding protein [Paracoccaceae bacterium]